MFKDIVEFPNYKISEDGRVYNIKRAKLMSIHLNGGTKHLKVMLSKGGKTYNRLVHRLVLETFIGSCPEGMECCHNNGDPADNRLENLRWGTSKSNGQDMVKHGTSTKGEKNRHARLNTLQVRIIKRLLNAGLLMQKEIAEIFNISKMTINDIARNRTWNHIKL